LTDAREVVAVGRLVVGPGAALHPDREQHDDEDGARDESRASEHRTDHAGALILASRRRAVIPCASRTGGPRGPRPPPPPPWGPPPEGRPPVRDGGEISRVSSSTKSKSRMSSSCKAPGQTP